MPCPRGPDAKVVSDPTSAKVVSDPTNNNNLASLLVRSARRFPAFPAIAVVANNCPEYIEALFACWSAGCSAVPVNSKLHPNELGYILQDSGARWAFVD